MQENNGGYSLSDIRAVTGGNNDGFGLGGNGAWWIIILLLFGWGRNGFGNGSGDGGNGGSGGGWNFCGCGVPWATQADVRAAVDQQTLISKLDQQTYGIADATYALNNAITGGFSQAELSRCQQQAALMAQLNAMMAADAKCCCETQRLIERGFADTNYNMATQACETRNTIQNTTRDIIDNANANSRAIIDFLTQDKIATLTAENQSLRFAASQSNQNAVLMAAMDANKAEILRRTGAECPSPAYLVNAPTPVSFPVNSCGQVQFGRGYGGCGCGCDGGYGYSA